MKNPDFGVREPMRRATAADPCPICSKPDWCGVSHDGRVAICMRTEGATATRNGGWLHHLTEPPAVPSRRAPKVVVGKNWHAEAERFAANLDPDRKRKFAASLGLPPDALDVLAVGFHPDDPAGPCFTFPEVNPAGVVVGVSRRWKPGGGPDGKDKMAMKGSHRGLTIPDGWRDRAGPVFVVEGPTDACAMHAAGLACVGRPGANMGADLLAELLRDIPPDRDIIVVGENDRKPDGKWPGRDGAVVVARRLAELLDRPVRWSLTPDGAKDPRAWLVGQVACAGESADWTQFGRTLSATLSATATTISPPNDPRDSGDESAGISSSGGWGPPAALPTMPGVPPFPLAVFPSKVRDYWRAAGEALSCPADYVAVPGLTLLGAAVGRSRAARVKSGYAESPLFWSAVFAPPGGTKSPALRAARAPLQVAEARWMVEHRDRMTLFDVEMDRHNAKVKDWRANGCNGEPPEKPRKPTLRQAMLDDTTVEATAKVLADNARGVAVVKDELIGFVRGQNQYKGGRGADREFWLSAWAGAPAKVNRSKDHDAGPLVIPHPFVAVAGMLCPDSLPELRGENRNGDAQADGFLDRFLLSFPDPVDASPETWRVIPENVEQGYCDVFLDLLGMEMVPELEGLAVARHRPYYVQFSPEGRAAWEEFTGNMADRMNALDKFDPFRGVLSKLRGYGLRFASLFWCLRRACGELGQDEPIGAEIMTAASVLVDYFEKHAARCLGRGWADRPIRVATRLLAWLARNPERKAFNRTEAFLALKDKRDVKSSESLNPAFRLLVDHGYLRPLDRPENVRPGPVPETYTVNPAWARDPS